MFFSNKTKTSIYIKSHGDHVVIESDDSFWSSEEEYVDLHEPAHLKSNEKQILKKRITPKFSRSKRSKGVTENKTKSSLKTNIIFISGYSFKSLFPTDEK